MSEHRTKKTEKRKESQFEKQIADIRATYISMDKRQLGLSRENRALKLKNEDLQTSLDSVKVQRADDSYKSQQIRMIMRDEYQKSLEQEANAVDTLKAELVQSQSETKAAIEKNAELEVQLFAWKKRTARSSATSSTGHWT